MIIKKVYKFNEEFCEELKIPTNQKNRRKKELLEWLKNFYNYELLPGKPLLIQIKEVYGEYQPLPRNFSNKDLFKQKMQDYEKYTLASLGTEFKPNSKSKVARDAIVDFGLEKYGHNNQEYIAKTFIKNPFDKYGESDHKSIWVYYDSYEPMEKNILS